MTAPTPQEEKQTRVLARAPNDYELWIGTAKRKAAAYPPGQDPMAASSIDGITKFLKGGQH